MEDRNIGRDERERQVQLELSGIQARLRSIDSKLTAYSSFLLLLRLSDIYVLEILLILNSLWAAWVLMTGPSNFSAQPTAYQIMMGVSVNEGFWGIFALVSAAVKIAGISASYLLGRKCIWCLTVRSIGLSMSGVFWCTVGITVMIGNPDSLFCFGAIVLGVFAWWSVIRLAR